MKSILISFLVFAAAVTSMAQSSAGVSTVQKPSVSTSTKSKGVKVGLVYSNLTDASVRYSGTTTTQYGSYSYDETSHSGAHIGLMGVSAGWRDKYLFTSMLGLDVSGTILKSINGSELESKVTVFKTTGALIVPFTDMFSFVGGLNFSYFSELDSSYSKTEPGAGLDAALQLDVANGMGISAGMQLLGVQSKSKETDAKAEIYINGFIAQLSYVF